MSVTSPSPIQRIINWLWNLLPRNHVHHQRRLTDAYCQKKQKVKNLWIGAGIIVLLNPLPHFAVFVGLLTTFLAFSILDETP